MKNNLIVSLIFISFAVTNSSFAQLKVKPDSFRGNMKMDSMKQSLESMESSENLAAKSHLRWGIKTSVLSDADHKTESVSNIMALHNFPLSQVSDRDARYSAARIPTKVGPDNLKEGDIVTINDCYIQLIKIESDKDYHIEINGTVGNKTKCMIIEIPEGDLVEGGEGMGSKFDQLRQMVSQYLTGNLLSKPLHIQVTGQLMYDDDHVEAADASGGRGSKDPDGMRPTNLWELHPVIDIQFLK